MQPQKGFTLIEVVLSLSILMVVTLAIITMTGRTVHVSTTSDREQAAIQLVTDRTDLVRTDPSYANLDGYAVVEDSFPTLPGYTRTTTVVRDTTNGHDFKTISVTVAGPGLPNPVSRTVTVAAP